jgi:hypothetical protein
MRIKLYGTVGELAVFAQAKEPRQNWLVWDNSSHLPEGSA